MINGKKIIKYYVVKNTTW